MDGDVRFLGTLEETRLLIRTNIITLRDGKVTELEDIQNTLHVLSRAIKKIGVEEECLYILFELVFEIGKSGLRNAEKRLIIRELLIPNPQYQLSTKIIYRILSNIGVGRASSDKSRLKGPTLNIGLQIYLLEWLLKSLHLFGSDIYKDLNRMLPILFSNLSYEYLRPFIANLISLAIINGKEIHKTYFGKERVHIIPSFKPWHVQLVVDLHFKFPTDNHLRGLLILFKSQDPALDLNTFSPSGLRNLNDLGIIDSGLFAYSNESYLNIFKNIKEEYKKNNELIDSRTADNNLRKYRTFSQLLNKRKRQKRNPSDHIITLVGLHDDDRNVPINEVGTIENLVEEFNRIQVFDSSDIVKPRLNPLIASNKLKRHYIALQGLNGNIKILKKLDYYIGLTIIDEGSTIKDLDALFTKIVHFTEFGSIFESLSMLREFILNEIYQIIQERNSEITPFEFLSLKLKIIPYIPPSILIKDFDSILSDCLNVFLAEPKKAGNLHYLVSFLNTMMETLLYFFQYSRIDSENKFSSFEVIKKSIPKIFYFLTYNYIHNNLELQLAILGLLNFVKSIGVDIINEYFDALFLILEPSMVYRLLLSNNPFVVSELCGYISFCKGYTFKNGEEKFQSLHKSYVMDILNFLWRDMALHQSIDTNSNERGMFLTPNIINQLELLPIFNYSSFLKVSNIGNLFQSPTWSYITARIIWNLEDKDGSVTIRHEGPVTEDSVWALNQNRDVKWLNLNYRQLKLAVLKELEVLGYSGLCDLLFSSIASLVNERNSI